MNSGHTSLGLAASLVLVALVGCAVSHGYLAPTLLQAREHNQRAIDAEARGQQARARGEFETALRLSASIEDNEGTVTALINLARLARRDGDLARGRALMEQALAKVSAASPLVGEVAFEEALQLLANGDAAAAESRARQALAASSSGQRAARANLLARVLWRLQRPAEASAASREALSAVDAAAAPAEAANAHRLLAEIAAAAGDPARAEQSYRQALAFDRRAGLSVRIANDLRGLAELAVGSGQIREATGLLLRAFEVALNGGDTAAASADLERLATLYRQVGDPLRAAQIEAQRDALQGATPAAQPGLANPAQ